MDKKPIMQKLGLEGFNKPKRTPSHPKKSHVVMAKEGDKTKLKDFVVSVGEQFGSLTVDRFEYVGKNRTMIAKCGCGNEKTFWKKSAIKKVKSCGCGIDNNGITAKQRRTWSFRYHSYRSGALQRKYEWSLTFSEFVKISSGDCYYCSSLPRSCNCMRDSPSVRKDTPNTKEEDYEIFINGIDRVNNSIGYTVENCVSCCVYCNRAKSDLSYNEFKEHITNIYLCLSIKDKNQ